MLVEGKEFSHWGESSDLKMSVEGEEFSHWCWFESLDSPTQALFRDLTIFNGNDPCSPTGSITSLHHQRPPWSPILNFSDCLQQDSTTPAGNTNTLSTPICLSLLRVLITDVSDLELSDLESESLQLEKLGDEEQLVCLKLSIIKEVLLELKVLFKLADCSSGKLKLFLQKAATLKPIPVFIEETMTNPLRFLIESTAQYALSQILATVENPYQSALTTSLQPSVLDPHNNKLHRCKIASLMYMFSLDSGMDEDHGHPIRSFELKLPFWTPNVQFYYRKESPVNNHAQYYNERGTLVLPVFEASRQSCVGVLELIMTSQKISYAPEHVKVTKSSGNEKLDLRLDCFQILQTSRSPPQPQTPQNGGAIENGSNVISASQSHNALAISKIEDTGQSLKIISRKRVVSIDWETLQQNFHLTLLDAARNLNVSRSTLKRYCRQNGILEWPSRKRNKLNPVGKSVPSVGAYNPTLATSPNPPPTVVVPDQPMPPGYEHQREKGESLCHGTGVGFGQVERLLDYMPGGFHNELCAQTGNLPKFSKMTPTEDLLIGVSNERCSKVGGFSQLVFQPTIPNPSVAYCNPDAILSTLLPTPQKNLRLIRSVEGFSEDAVLGSSQRPGPAPKQVKTNLARAVPNVTVRQEVSTLIVKATYREDMIRFRFPSTSGMKELKNEVTKRLPLKVGTFNIKYKDDNQDLILMGCDADFQECKDIWTSLGNNEISLFIHDKVSSSRIHCESRRGKKRNQTYISEINLP